MTADTRFRDLQQRLDEMSRRIDSLEAREDIRACLYRFGRGLDRMDLDLMASAFHPGATVDYGKIFSGNAEDFVVQTMAFQKKQFEVHHLIGNIAIELYTDTATVESYELGRHKSPRGGQLVDLVLAFRTLDRFALRGGEWKITHRKRIVDWARIMSGADDLKAQSPLEAGTRDQCDASYSFLSRDH